MSQRAQHLAVESRLDAVRRPRPALAAVVRGGGPRRAARALPPLATCILILGLWQAGAFHRLFGLQIYTLAYPSDIAATLRASGLSMLARSQPTFMEIAAGYTLGSSLGFLLATLMLWSAPVRQVLYPVTNGLNAMPVVALAPLMVLYFGSGVESKIGIITLMAIPPMVVHAYKGFISIDADTRDLLWTYAATEMQSFLKLRLPASLPFVFTALKLNVTLAIVGAIIGEFFSSQGGLGFIMSRAIATFDMPVAWSTIAIAGALGVVLYLVVNVLERSLIPWHASVRSESNE